MKVGDLIQGNMEVGCVFLYTADTFETLSAHGPSVVGIILSTKMEHRLHGRHQYVKVLMGESVGWVLTETLKVIE